MMVKIAVNSLLVIAAFIAHEMGHFISASIFRIKIKKVGIHLSGPYVQRERSTGWPEVLTCLAGVIANATLAAAFYNINHWFFLCNFTFAWVNILPIPKSDGTHALEALRVIAN